MGRPKKKISLAKVKKSLKNRTIMDKKRKHNPLIRVKDSILINTDILDKKQMIIKMSKEIDKITNNV
tara:strand:- start:1028 stop:1228 length:201 start_codon:yes stop_codon:yes gene_type:complete